MIKVFNLMCKECDKPTSVEVSVGTHVIRIVSRNDVLSGKDEHKVSVVVNDEDGVWIKITCPKCVAKALGAVADL